MNGKKVHRVAQLEKQAARVSPLLRFPSPPKHHRRTRTTVILGHADRLFPAVEEARPPRQGGKGFRKRGRAEGVPGIGPLPPHAHAAGAVEI